jgi:signal transduction histidine kinase
MRDAVNALNWATEAGFVLLAIASIRQYVRHPQRHRLDLAAAILLLTVLVALSRLQALLPAGTSVVLGDVSITLLLASAYAFLRFRADFIPLPRPWELGVLTTLGAILVYWFVVTARGFGSHPTTLPKIGIVLVVCAWAVCIGEPVVRFVQASRGRPPVQRHRLQTMAGGYLALVLVLVIAGFASNISSNDVISLVVASISLASVPLIYAGFAAPAWLRRFWREQEEEAFRHATGDLVTYSPTRGEMARRAVEWAVRLTGGDGAFIAEPGGQIVAAAGVDSATAAKLLDRLPLETEEPVDVGGNRTAFRLPLLSPGSAPASMVVLTGSFTPFFGTDELLRLRHYAINTAAGLDRASLTERVTALERTKTEFLNLASHELRAPLTVIRGYLSMVKEGSFGPVPGELGDVVPVLLDKADQMNRLVEQMLEASRLEEGRLELKLETADLRELVRAAIEETRPLRTPIHQVQLDAPPSEVPVRVDRQRVTTIVSNLISNAIKYSPSGGEVRLLVDGGQAAALVAVRDEGVGIDPHDRERVFTRFGRITTAETRNVPGTGLGLYLSRELARLHGGDLTFQSQPGSGSTFTLELPLETHS